VEQYFSSVVVAVAVIAAVASETVGTSEHEAAVAFVVQDRLESWPSAHSQFFVLQHVVVAANFAVGASRFHTFQKAHSIVGSQTCAVAWDSLLDYYYFVDTAVAQKVSRTFAVAVVEDKRMAAVADKTDNSTGVVVVEVAVLHFDVDRFHLFFVARPLVVRSMV
jgi:hypothetical protein